MKLLSRSVVLLVIGMGVSTAMAAPGFYRFPAVHGDTVVFTAEGDLWKVPVAGGTAARLTSHPGTESFAAISPDGKTVAFSAEYEGPAEVYVMPMEGGLPKRLTWSGEGAFPTGWTPQGQVIYTTKAFSTLPNDQLALVNPTDGAESILPLAQASEGVMDAAGTQLFFTRLPFQGSSTKRYQGGTAQHLWRWDQGAEEAVPLTPDFAGTSKNPMWWEGRVYFLSDRSGIANLWSMLPDGKDVQALTKHADFDIKWARLQNGRIVYQQGADLRLFTLAGAKDEAIPIALGSDFDQTRERWVEKPMDFLTSARLSPEGSKVVLTARGEIFVAPAEPGGRFVNVPRKEGVRYREASFLGDEKAILAQTDETGELEFVKLPANGVGTPEILTRDGTIFRMDSVASPDGRRVAWQDKNQQLWIRDLGAGQSRLIATSLESDFEDLVWSPDGQWLAYVETQANSYRQIKLCKAADGSILTATSGRVNSFSPAWSTDGKWLYFCSEREMRSLVSSPWGDRQPEPFFTETTKLYGLALRKDLRSPFMPPDELNPAPSAEEKARKKEAREAEKTTPDPDKERAAAGAEDKGAESKKDSPSDDAKDKPAKPAVVEIEADGLASRLWELPVPAGNFGHLEATAKHLFYSSRATGFEEKPRLMRLEITSKDPKPKPFADEVKSWEISANRKQLLLRKGEAFYVVPVDGEAPAKLEKPVPLDRWSFSINPREEWRQIYHEAWRMLRDYFYDAKLHGVDWLAVRKKYEPLVDRVADREDLSEVLHEMSGELSALHTYVRHGETREAPDKIEPSSLGARLVRDAAAGGWRVEHVFVADPDYPEALSPLAKPGVAVKDGDVIVRINGVPLDEGVQPSQLLRQQAGRQVLLELKAAVAGAPGRQVLVKPLSPDAARDLRYAEWEYTRRLKTEELGQGQIGYLHLRAMGSEDIADWARDFYPVFQRQGLIIDVRHNRGGNIDSWILSKLMRKAWFYWSRRTGNPYSNMQYAFRGHVVVLCNERTASDGEAFSEGFKRLGLGKVIGTRTWGGEIWLSAKRWLVDNGMCSAAESGVYGPEGKWLIEGHGVDPDVVVDNLPKATFAGHDAQLEAAVKHLQELILKDPRPVPPVPPKPDKSFK
ncbi:MAG: protease [Verrucomicrobiales bacterium]|nr:protease [Verrucomicrobiales bacterium]